MTNFDRAEKAAVAIKAQVHPKNDDPKLPPAWDLRELAECYLALAKAAQRSPPLLASERAVDEFALHVPHCSDREEARRELQERLLDAQQSTERPGEWRARSGGLDIIAHTRPTEGRLLIVARISVRDHVAGGRRRA